MDWTQFDGLLKDIFQPINEGSSLQSPQAFWQAHHQRIASLITSGMHDKFTELHNNVWSPEPYEVVRLLSNLRQRSIVNGGPNIGNDLVNSVRVEIESRKRPVRDTKTEDLAGVLRDIAEIGDKPQYSRFQWEGWHKAILALQERQGLIIVAPTGAGKTEVFLLPMVAAIAWALKENPQEVPHYVMVYPRVALLKDQLGRILHYAHNASLKYFTGTKSFAGSNHNFKNPIVVGLQYGGIRSQRTETYSDPEIFDGRIFKTVPLCPVCDHGRLERQDAEQGIVPLRCTNGDCSATFHVTLARNDLNPIKPHVLVTTIESLDRLYLNPKLEEYLQNLDALVFDEVHLYYSLYGAHVANIVNRIERFQADKKPLARIASSATVSNPTKFAAKLFYGSEEAEVDEHNAAIYPNQVAGLETVIFLRSPNEDDAPPPQSTLIQTAMAVGHGALGPEDRAILFTESVDHVNRTFLQLNDAEREQQLWKFRTVARDISFQGKVCPGTDAFQCTIYQTGECWRGALGGRDCVTFTQLRTQAMSINRISSKNPNALETGDLIIATASLEVGVDDPAFRATIHYRPPLSVFSFIQRRGRAGRRPDDIAYTVMVLGNDASDEFYFRRRNRLIDGSHYELPLNPENAVIRSMHEQLEKEREQIGQLNQQYNNLPKSILVWLLDKYRHCMTLQRLFGTEIQDMYQRVLIADATAELNKQDHRFRDWVAQRYRQFQQYLDLEVMLQELEARVPTDQQGLVTELRAKVYAYGGGDLTQVQVIKNLATQLVAELFKLQLDEAVQGEELLWLVEKVRQVATGYKLPEQLGVQPDEIAALYQFFTVLHEKLSDSKYGNLALRYSPEAIRLVLQSLFYSGSVCLQASHCPSCVDFFIPDSYFQEVKPILVQTLTASGEDSYDVEVEDSTRLASMLTPYKPFYRYFSNSNAMAILVTEHHPDWVYQNQDGETIVGIRLRAEGIHTNAALNPRRVFVKPIRPDSRGKNVVRLCLRCFRLHDEDSHQHRCNCGESLTTVKLYPEPIVSRQAEISDKDSVRLTGTFLFADRLVGNTEIQGSEVEYRVMLPDGGDYNYSNSRGRFTAIYQDISQHPEPLRYSIQTSGILWDLGHVVPVLLQDKKLSEKLKALGKLLSEDLILHTAAHMLYKAFASLTGVAEQVLEYAIVDHSIVVWERYEGGVGLSEIIRDKLREEPKDLYRELLASVLCPVQYGQDLSTHTETDESLRSGLATRWALGENDELIDAVVSEAKAERQAELDSQAEAGEEGCRDGCPACIHISMCTDRRGQSEHVSRLVAEELIGYFRRQVTQVQLDNLQLARLKDGLAPITILRVNDQQDMFDVVCF